MYELNRVRLVGIGPRGARYTDVTLDLSGVGAPVAPTALFESAIRRPSPHSLLMLENGGGKSVLLKLLFSVVLPGRRKTVGGAALDNFVLDGDTGHVALEWMHVSDGKRLVTAKVYQRRSRTSSNTNPLAEAWYSFRPSATLDLTTLPVADDGRRRRLDGYQEAVAEADRVEAATQLSWLGSDQSGWREHLRGQGIEPDLFDIQRSMNVDEGDAANAFKFTSSKQFVDWLLTTVTDPADAVSVAATFEQWATNLAERDAMLLERDFLEGAIVGLDSLAGQYTELTAAQHDAATAARTARALAAALTARRDAEEEAAGQLRDENEVARGIVTTRQSERDRAADRVNEVQRRTIELDLAATSQRRDSQQELLASRELELHGWDVVPLLAQRDGAIAEARALAQQVAAADESAAPAMGRRDVAAGLLLAKLHDEAKTADRKADDLDGDAADLDEQSEMQGGKREEALAGKSIAEEQQRTAAAQVEAATQRLRGAVDAGLLPHGVSPGDVPGHVTSATARHERLRGELEGASRRADDLGAEVEALAARVSKDSATVSTAGAATENARRLSQDAVRAAQRVGRLPAVVAVAGDLEAGTASLTSVEVTGEIHADLLDTHAEQFLRALAAGVDDHTTHLDGLRTQQREDQRVLDALGDGRLLPARPDVEAALDTLHAAGVAAHAGWRYLADSAAAQDRASLIATHPELADGIVVIDPTQLPAARDALDAARLLPGSAVSVGTGAMLLTLRGGEVDGLLAQIQDRFVIDPNPALFDEDAAAERREALRAEMDARAEVMTVIQVQLDEVKDAHTEVGVWRRQNPPGHLTSLRRTAERLAEAEQDARDALQGLREVLDASTGEHAEAAAHVDELRHAERAASDRVKDLSALADLVADAADAAARIPQMSAEATRLGDIAERAGQDRLRLAREAGDKSRAAEQSRGRAGRFREQTSTIVSTAGELAETVSEASIAELRSAYDAAHAAYLDVAADTDLRTSAEQASRNAAKLREQVDGRDARHVTEGERLLASVAGADLAGRAAARREAAAARNHLDEQVHALTGRVGELKEALKRASPDSSKGPTWTALPDEWVPTSVEHGRTLEVSALQLQQEARAAVDDASRHAARLIEQLDEAEATRQGIHTALLPLTTILDDDQTPPSPAETVDPFEGTISEADARSGQAVRDLRSSARRQESARQELDDAAGELKGFATQTRFDAMTNLVRRSLVESRIPTVAARAAEWSAQCAARHASLTTDIETASRHRKNIIERLAALVERALRTLRQATRLSRLPTGLGDWEGREFLRIRFSDPDSSSITLRVGDVVDDFAAALNARAVGARGSAPKRDGVALLLDAVHAAVPKGFTVDVLKPDHVLRDERVSIEEMNEVFSGGQELTAAIVLYCTLAALKANERGQMRSKHSGVLFLDNPIGKASATYLLDLQKGVAQALGVQLVYTTGLSDDRALAAFPLWVRMRNDADLRAGLKHIRVADEVRTALPEPFDDADLAAAAAGSGATAAAANLGLPGTVTATRLHRRHLLTPRPPADDDHPAAPAVSGSPATAASEDV